MTAIVRGVSSNGRVNFGDAISGAGADTSIESVIVGSVSTAARRPVKRCRTPLSDNNRSSASASDNKPFAPGL